MLKLPETEKSYWREAYTNSLYPKAGEDLKVDVAIIGAGITGLTSAYLLKQSGLNVAVLEKSTVGGGTTGRTTGKVTAQHNLIYNDLQQRLGFKTAQIYGRANQAAVERLGLIVKNENIDCDWQRDDNYVFTDDTSKVSLFKEEAKTAVAIGLPVSLETEIPLPFKIEAAVKLAHQAKIHSQKYLLGLARAVNGQGSFVFENSNVIGIRDGSPGRVKTKKCSIVAKDIIVASNVPTLPLIARGAYCALEYPTESYIVAGKLNKKLQGMYISPDENHHSILPIETGSGRLLLIGGESHISGLSGNKQTRYQRLANYAEEHFGITSITHRWSDRDYLSYDSVPLIGKLYPWSKHLYVGTGFMKWGLSSGTLAGMILHDLIMGVDNPWASVFNPNRLSPIKSIPRVIVKTIS